MSSRLLYLIFVRLLGGLAVKYRELVAQHEDLDVLVRVGSCEQNQPAHHTAGQQVHESKPHEENLAGLWSVMNAQVSLMVRVSGTHRAALLAASVAGWLHQLTATPSPTGLIGHGIRGGQAMIATLRHRLIRVPARLARHAGQLTLHLPPGYQLLNEILARIRALPTMS